MLPFKLFIRGEREAEEKPAWLVEMQARQDAAREYAERIQGAVKAAGLDPNMLDDLPATYVAAALILKVK